MVGKGKYGFYRRVGLITLALHFGVGWSLIYFAYLFLHISFFNKSQKQLKNRDWLFSVV